MSNNIVDSDNNMTYHGACLFKRRAHIARMRDRDPCMREYHSRRKNYKINRNKSNLVQPPELTF